MNLKGLLPSSSTSRRMERYKAIRARGRTLFSSVLEGINGWQYDVVKAARKLTVPISGRTLCIGDETDMNALCDFYLHEMRYGGRRVVDVCEPEKVCRDGLDQEVLEAQRRSYASLFQPAAVHPKECIVELSDLLEPDRPRVSLTDIHMTGSMSRLPPVDIFLRVLTVEELQFSSGTFFTFRREDRLPLINAYNERMQTVLEKEWSERKYIFFYREHRTRGLAQATMDVT